MDQLGAARSVRELSSQETDILSRSLDYLGQAYFNLNQQDPARSALLQLIEINPTYSMDEDLVSSKFIDLYTNLKEENLAFVSVSVVPAGATVKIDGRAVAAADLSRVPVLKGEHEVEAGSPGYLPLKKSVTVSAGQTASLKITLGGDPARKEAYESAMLQLRSYDAPSARDSLQRALAADAGNVMARAGLAEAWILLGSEKRAREEAEKALDQTSGSSADDTLLIQGIALEAAGDYAGASGIYSKHLLAHPDSVDSAVRLARTQLRGGKPTEAIETARRQRFRGANDPRLDLLEAEASGLLADYEDQRSLAAAAASAAKSRNALLLAARARLVEAGALLQLNNKAQARHAFEEVLSLPEIKTDACIRAQAHLGLGSVLLASGDPSGAEMEFHLAQDLLLKLGNESLLPLAGRGLEEAALTQKNQPGAITGSQQPKEGSDIVPLDDHNRVVALLQQGFEALNRKDYKGAAAMFERALTMAQQIGDRSSQANALNSIGFIYSRQGDDAAARQRWQQAADISQQAGDKSAQATALFNLATAEYNLGNQQKAESLYEQSAALYREIGQTPRPKPW